MRNIFFNNGNVYCEKGDYQQAIIDWNMAIKIKPDYADAFYNRGFVYLKYLVLCNT
jgi:tetratricopeptide (TPR) repeat protein